MHCFYQLMAIWDSVFSWRSLLYLAVHMPQGRLQWVPDLWGREGYGLRVFPPKLMGWNHNPQCNSIGKCLGHKGSTLWNESVLQRVGLWEWLFSLFCSLAVTGLSVSPFWRKSMEIRHNFGTRNWSCQNFDLGLNQKLILPEFWSWTSQLPKLWEIKFCSL
jgi:hypothetical protein